MESLLDDVTGDVLLHAKEPQTPRAIFERLLPKASNVTPQSGAGDKFHHIRVVTNFEGHAKYATTRKVGNLRFNVKNAVLDEIPDLIETVAAVVAGSVVKVLMPIAVLQLLRYLRDLSTIELTETDAVVLKKLFELGGDDRTVEMEDLASSTGLSSGAVEASIPKLQKLGCVSTVGNEVVLNESIEFQQDT